MKCLIYCTMAKPYCMVGINGNKTYLDNGGKNSVFSPDHNYNGNGKIVAEFDCDKVEKHIPFLHWCIGKETCLTRDEVLDYLDRKDTFVGNPKRQGNVYCNYISNLKVFDEPLELYELRKDCVPNRKKCEKCKMFDFCMCDTLTKAPRNIQKVWYKGEMRFLIPCSSKECANLLNGKATIIVRKRVPNIAK